MNENLLRKLSIGFMDRLSVKRRSFYIEQGFSTKEVCKLEKFEYDYSSEALSTLRWLENGKTHSIKWIYEKGYPCFEGVERRIPFFLLTEGSFPETDNLISVVGTRHPSYEAYKQAFKLGYEIVSNGMEHVSGLAEGCDQASSIGAVACKGKSYAVIGCGHNIKYPSLTFRLRQEIIENGGGIISRFAPETNPSKYTFPNRNLIIAALSRCTIIVQAPFKSGSLITGDMALQLGKDLYVSKAGIDEHIQSRGSKLLWQSGCPVIEHLYDIDDNFSLFLQKDSGGSIRFSDSYYVLKSKE